MASGLPGPKPIFILQNSKPITKVLFSTRQSDLLYSGNRAGDFTVYNLKLRRSLFQQNINSQSILSILEINESHVLTYARNGSLYKWSNHESKYEANCELIQINHIYSIRYNIYGLNMN